MSNPNDYSGDIEDDRDFGDEPDYDDRDDEDDGSPEGEERARRRMFANPGGNSALRAASPRNPRNLPCPTCEAPNRLTPADRACGYQCDSCADQDERGGY